MLSVRERMTESLRVRYMAIVSCGQCPECEFDDIDKVFRCRRSTMEKKVDPFRYFQIGVFF